MNEIRFSQPVRETPPVESSLPQPPKTPFLKTFFKIVGLIVVFGLIIYGAILVKGNFLDNSILSLRSLEYPNGNL